VKQKKINAASSSGTSWGRRKQRKRNPATVDNLPKNKQKDASSIGPQKKKKKKMRGRGEKKNSGPPIEGLNQDRPIPCKKGVEEAKEEKAKKYPLAVEWETEGQQRIQKKHCYLRSQREKQGRKLILEKWGG